MGMQDRNDSPKSLENGADPRHVAGDDLAALRAANSSYGLGASSGGPGSGPEPETWVGPNGAVYSSFSGSIVGWGGRPSTTPKPAWVKR